MHNRLFVPALFLSLFVFAAGCATTASVIESCEYDTEKDQTVYTVLPYGSAALPGKWGKDHYNSVSHQQFFRNADSVEIAIAFHPAKGYPFNGNGKLKGHDFVKAFYEWDSHYFVEAHGLKREIIEADSARHYLVWRLYGSAHTTAYDTYFLFGEKNGNASNLSVTNTDRWTAGEKTAFLKGLFLGKE